MLFDESIKSEYTRKNYNIQLKPFRKYVELSSNKDLLTMTQDRLQILLEDYLIHLRRTANPNSVPSKFQGIRHFGVMNRVYIDWEIIRKMFPQRQKMPTLRAYTSEEILSMLDNVRRSRNLALIHFLASTGARIDVFDHKITLKHIKRMPKGAQQ